MNSIKLADSNTQLKQVTEDLRVIQTVIATIEGEEAISCERETLTVVLRALEPIIQDVDDTTMTLTELCEEIDGLVWRFLMNDMKRKFASRN